jgi:tetratricopeptide (TPR) repeat protein
MNKPLVELVVFLKEMRLERDWSEADLEGAAGLPPGTVRDYERDPEKLTREVGERVIYIMHPSQIIEAHVRRAKGRDPSEPPKWLLNQMEARMIELEAALCIDEKRFPAALKALDQALVLDRRPEQQGRFFLSKAAVLGELGRELQALEILERAESCLDLEKSTLWLRLRLDQLYFLCYAQRFEQAEALLAEARELAAAVGRPAERLELDWLSGRVFAGLGRLDEALSLLENVYGEHRAAGHVFEAISAALDVAAVLTAQGNHAPVKEMARELESWTQNGKLTDASRSTLRVFCKLSGSGLKPERAKRLAGEFRKTDTRLTRPYMIPV